MHKGRNLPLLGMGSHLSFIFALSSMIIGGPLAALTSKPCCVTVALLIVIPFSALICTFVKLTDGIGLSGKPTTNPAILEPVAMRLVMLMS